MKLTIIPSDEAVYKDGVSYLELNLVGIPADVHALQWEDTNGWVEYEDDKINESITELPQWALNALEAWNTANIEAELQGVV